MKRWLVGRGRSAPDLGSLHEIAGGILVQVRRLTLGRLKTHAYLVWDGVHPEAVLIDAPEDSAGLVAGVDALLAETGCTLSAVIATHGHWDHVGGVAALVERYRVPFWIGRDAIPSLAQEAERAAAMGYVITHPPAPDRGLVEGEVVAVGDLRLEVLATPGHWVGDISLWERPAAAIFSGDAIFREDIGAYNKGCDRALLLQSIRSRLMTKPDETTLYPGHGRLTTVGHERVHNRWLQGE